LTRKTKEETFAGRLKMNERERVPEADLVNREEIKGGKGKGPSYFDSKSYENLEGGSEVMLAGKKMTVSMPCQKRFMGRGGDRKPFRPLKKKNGKGKWR